MTSEFLTQDEVDALLEGVPEPAPESASPSADASGARPYDLLKARPLVARSIPALDAVHERFARLLRGALFTLLRRPAEPVPSAGRAMTYADFIASLATPTAFNVVEVKPPLGRAVIALDAALVHQSVDALFGGDGRFQPRLEAREFTFTERRIVERLMFLMLDEYEKAWKDAHPLSFKLARFEACAPFVPIVAPNDPVLVTTYTLAFGAIDATFHVCLPYAMLDPIRASLEERPDSTTVEPDRRWLASLSRQVQAAEVELVADLVNLSVTVQQLLTMRVGDILSADISELVTADVDGIPILQCRYGTSNGRYALRVNKVLAPDREYAGEAHA